MSELVRPFDAERDHWRGGKGVVVLEYGDYECPYSRQAFRNIEQLQAQDSVAALRFPTLPSDGDPPSRDGRRGLRRGRSGTGALLAYA